MQDEAIKGFCNVCKKDADKTFPFYLRSGSILDGNRICERCRAKDSTSWGPCVDCGRVFINLALHGCAVSGGHQCVFCVNKDKSMCAHCETWKPKDSIQRIELKRTGHIDVCSECAANVIKCKGCEKQDFSEFFRFFSEDRQTPFCPQCYEARFFCYYCEQVFRRNDTERIRTPEGTDVCQSCFDERFIPCDGCDQYMDRETVQYLPEDEDHSRPRCRRCMERAMRDRVTARHMAEGHIFNYTFNVPRGLGIIPKKTDKLYGVELEVSVNDERYSMNQIAASVYKHGGGKLVIKSDSSISHGFEIVTAPLVHDVIKEMMGNVLTHTKGRLLEDDSCGMHVHVSRAAASPPRIARMIRFLHHPANHNFVEWIAGRSNQQYASLAARHWKDAGIFSEATRDMDSHVRGRGHEMPVGVLPRMAQVVQQSHSQPWMNGGRYQAINLCNRDTIEFRMFATTVDPERFGANLDFCHALVDFTGEFMPLAEQVSVERFLQFVRDRKVLYPQLVKRFTDNEAEMKAALERKTTVRKPASQRARVTAQQSVENSPLELFLPGRINAVLRMNIVYDILPNDGTFFSTAPQHSGPRCGSTARRNDGTSALWYCTRPAGHSSHHVAHADRVPLATWQQTT